MHTQSLFTTLALTTALIFADRAQAAPAPTQSSSQMSLRVSVADLDLRRNAGADVAQRRIRRAAVVICGDEPQSSGLARYGLFRSCVRTTVRNALASRSAQLAWDPDSGPFYVETILAAIR